MKIYDGFLFNDELDLLELRFMETYDLVDRYVLVEAKHNWQQKPKQLHYLANKERFAKWNDKVIHFALGNDENGYKLGPYPYIEWPQRRYISRGFGGADMTDIVLIGDADEIPSREALEALRKKPPGQPVVLQQHLYYYRVNNMAGFWRGTIAMPRGLGDIDCQQIRDTRCRIPQLPVACGGWHFSWMGEPDDILGKLRCHTIQADNDYYGSNLPFIPDPDNDANFVRRAVITGHDLFKRKKNYVTVPLSPGKLHPHCIKEWLDGKQKYAA